MAEETTKATGGTGGEGQEGKKNTSETLVYETWIKEQPEPVKAMFDEHVKGLKSALSSERGTREAAEKQLRELAGKAEAGSEAQKRLNEVADQMSESNRKAEFYEAAHAAGVSNLRLAYMAAVQDDLFDKKNQVNFEALKAKYPELFKKTVEGNAGNGTNNGQPAAHTMNDFIRMASGRK